MRFVTLFLNYKPIHRKKDVGMIPFVLKKNLKVDSLTASYYIEKEIDGLENIIIQKKFKSDILNGILFLLSNAKSIDVLNLYHYKLSTFIWILVYKLLNPKGKIYLKLDIDTSAGKNMRMKRCSYKFILTKYVLGLCELISAETKEMVNYANEFWPITLTWIPNGVNEGDIHVKNKKENIILTVGRLGTRQKATENLVEAYKTIFNHFSESWDLYCVGPYSDEFKQYIDTILESDPELSKHIKLFGSINDEEYLKMLYRKSKIFCLPSRWESFGLVLGEALAAGCYIISSDIVSAKEITNYGKYGALVPVDDIKTLAKIILKKSKCCYDDINFDEIENWLKENYTWEKTVEILYSKLQNGYKPNYL